MPDDACLFVLKDCYRLLKPGGMMRIATPDMDKAIEAYNKNDSVWFDEGGISLAEGTLERKLVNCFASYKLEGYSGGPIVEPEVVREKLQTLDKHEFAKWCVSQIPEEAPYRAHINAYDFDKMKSFLEKAGFGKIDRSEYRKSAAIELRDEAFDNRPEISLYIEATK